MTIAENIPNDSIHIAGLGKRFLAFIMDDLLLAAIGLGLGFFLYDDLVRIGGWGRLAGFAIAVTYFGVMDSRIGGGQTLGKIAMKIKVISRNGTPLSVGTSLLRAGIFSIPYFLNGAPIDLGVMHSWPDMALSALISALIFGLGFSILYLLLCNRATRQSLHDLAVNAYVVSRDSAVVTPRFATIWVGHIVIVTVLCVLAISASIFTGQLVNQEPFLSLLPLQRAISVEPGVRGAGVTVGANILVSSQNERHSTKGVSIRVFVDSKTVDQEALANRIARLTLNTYAEASNKDVIAIFINYGYDIGIASAWEARSFSHSPAEWRNRLAQKTP